ncbi:unnamed protein product [Phyllotreta striolata]|uniref:Mitochondrial inner membrane protein Mpv17 n=1 Tax=Phyllotreta striolata TaxID=444603 RepID=A0A9N9XJ15_PHYSR|nr:unnamed protein product [Phyllotreta striolata]
MKFFRFQSTTKFIEKNKHLRTHSIQTGLLMGAGDCIAQTIVEKTDYNQIDGRRTARYAFVGLVFVGPALTTWYTFLNRKLPQSRRLFSAGALMKVALDQLVFAPLFLPIWMATVNFMEGKSLAHIKNELNLKYTDILLTNYTVWPTVQMLNFGLVPIKFQVMFTQTIGVLWNTYLSHKVHDQKQPAIHQETDKTSVN